MKPGARETVTTGDKALGIMLGELGGRFGVDFADAPDMKPLDIVKAGTRAFTHYLAPADDPSRVFSATVRADAETGEVLGPTLTDWPQYLFRDRFLAPFAESLAGAAVLAGWGLTMTHVRYDARAWSEGDFEGYVGAGVAGDPEARVILVLPAEDDVAACANAISGALAPVYGLGRNVNAVAVRAGRTPQENPLYVPDASYRTASGRGRGPSADEVREGIERRSWRGTGSAWDGTSTGGDPGLETYLPQVTWNPGFGPGE